MPLCMHPSTAHPDVDRAWTSAFLVSWDRPTHLLAGALAYLAMDDRVSLALARPGKYGTTAPGHSERVAATLS